MEETKFTITFRKRRKHFCLELVVLCLSIFTTVSSFAQTCPINLVEITAVAPCGDGSIYLQEDFSYTSERFISGGTTPSEYDYEDSNPANNDVRDGFTGVTAGTNNVPTFPTVVGAPNTPGVTPSSSVVITDNTTAPGDNGERYQADGWILVPPTVGSFNISIKDPTGNPQQSAAIWLGDGINGTSGMAEIQRELTAAGGATTLTPAGNVAFAVPATAPVVTDCGWRAVRFRLFLLDETLFSRTRVTWDALGNMAAIPKSYVHSVTTPDADDNLDALMMDSTESVRFAYQDAGGALFNLSGGTAMALNSCETSCIAQTNVEGLGCTRPITSQPLCQLTVVEVTPRIPTAGTGPYTQFLSGSNGDDCGTGGSGAGDMVALILSCFFNEYEGNTCLPTRSGMSVVPGVTTIGANDAAVGGNSVANNDVDEGVQQDAWLMIPNGVSNIKFEIGGAPGIDFSALYLGKDYDDLKFVGQTETGPAAPPPPIEVDYGIPCDVETVSCGRRIIRLRHYTVDDGVGFNTIVRWDIGDGNGFVNIPVAAIYPATSATDNVVPTIGFTNQPTVEVIQDARGDYYVARTGFGLPALGQCELATEARYYPNDCDILKSLPDEEWCTSPLCLEIRDVNKTICAPIPTMSEWGLLIFGLLTLNLGLIFVGRMKEVESKN